MLSKFFKTKCVQKSRMPSAHQLRNGQQLLIINRNKISSRFGVSKQDFEKDLVTNLAVILPERSTCKLKLSGNMGGGSKKL